MMKNKLTYLLAALVLSACSGGGSKNSSSTEVVDELRELAMMNFMPLEASEKPDDPNNPKIVLGKKIFFEKGLSSNNTVSCNSCHNMDNYGVDNLALSNGVNGGMTERNSPTVLNVQMHIAQFWDGRAATLRDQIRMPLMNDAEMAMSDEETIVKSLNDIPGYKEIFAEVYPESGEIKIEDMSDAVATYIESLVFPSKFDKYLTDNSFNLNDKELSGLDLFMSKNCTDCHQGQLLGGDGYEKFGVHDIYWKYTRGHKIDSGKYLLSRDPDDLFVFKVPSLRNAAKTYPYFHDGSVYSLENAIQIMGKIQLNEDINAQEASDIAAFLSTLTGEDTSKEEITASIK